MQTVKRIKYALFIFLINFIVKTYKIENGSRVIWDEAHFGKFGSKYLRREFYFDVHPPLGKMLTALSGYLFNQDLEFKFESGAEYPSSMDYVGMRRFHALISNCLPVFAFGILVELGRKEAYSFLFSLLFVFENGFTCISRLILLDSHLLFFTAATAYFFTKFFVSMKNSKERSVWGESVDLCLLGVSLGCVMSVKWIGCLTVLLVGVYIIFELWNLLFSRKRINIFIYRFLLRFCMLILVPVFLYLLYFVLHFNLCNTSTSDEAHMSSLFQASLRNSSLERTKKYVSFGSVISLKASKPAGGNLHSHIHTYPNSDFKQITTYFHKDNNNHWAFQKVIEEGQNVDYLSDKDEVVLFHISTKAYLAIDTQNAYRSEGKRVVGIKDKITKECVKKIKSITTLFTLKNKETGMYLSVSGKNLPEWAFSQGEVTCIENEDKGTLWNVEENKVAENDTDEEYTEIKSKKSNFIKHVVELNIAMYNTNKSLKQDENLQPVRIVSRPHEWFFLKRGLRMNGWEDSKPKFYMFGNPLVWYASCLSVTISPIILLIRVIRAKRNNTKIRQKEFFKVFLSSGGWAIHYLPFFVIGRVLYFHHYYPAYFFAILSLDYVLDVCRVKVKYFAFFVAFSLCTFLYFKDLTYGIRGPAKNLINKQWLKSWDFL
ncbi:hypothetical protein EDEG_05086 [Edhazardia aedis USNM 41457]|uniref:Dolichyl-phosphate-mannose--protein mannosyltransferase n=1 Tax=Edhazardia aedis (strain USNM 41457) TaxID=1003232 RepID=A0A0L1P6H4_EDHAE|nr:hypothetical protein EDEG_05086 [Edhazardia aedis USNM 41457]|eukprot:KNH48531.1 hypothetical protein EDEG_05086 [Edhazardia aedis USNM 41457]